MFFSSSDGKVILKLIFDVWVGLFVEEVDYFLYDINGFKMYFFSYDLVDKFVLSVDGRKWGGYVLLRWSGFIGKWFLKLCKGLYWCFNEMCGYYR